MTDDLKLRGRNRHAVEQYLRTEHEARLDRYLLYTEDGTHSLVNTDIGRPIVIRGREKLKRKDVVGLEVLPDWQWSNVVIYETNDPGTIWVECDGEGTIRFPDYPEGHYRNHFVYGFTLVDGFIAASREFANPIEQMRSLGIETPRMKRDFIPE